MKRKILGFCLLLLLISPLSLASADTISINLNDFFADFSVSIAADGLSATMNEDPFLSTVLLSNDPFFGDPGIAVPPSLLTLSFNYSFTEGIDNDDNFYVKVFNGGTGDILNEFLSVSSDSGTISWDLSSLAPGITLLGLEFQLNSVDSLFDSFANISNVNLETAAAPVPEPGTLILLGSGLVGLIGFGRRKLLHNS